MAIPTTRDPAALEPARWLPIGKFGGVVRTGPKDYLLVYGSRRVAIRSDGTTSMAEISHPSDDYNVRGIEIHGKQFFLLSTSNRVRVSDAPLGPLRELFSASEDEFISKQVVANWVVVSGKDKHPLRIFDPKTGTENPPEFDMPVRHMVFADASHGVALTSHRGFLATSNAGKTWRALDAEAPYLGGTEFDKVLWLGTRGEIFVRTASKDPLGSWETGVPQRVDPALGTLTPMPDASPAAPHAEKEDDDNQPFRVWARNSGGEDPLASAVAEGVRVGPREALVGGKGGLFRVNLAHGIVTEVIPVRLGPASSCTVDQAGSELWALCAVGRERAELYRLTALGREIQISPPAVRPFGSRLLVAASGALGVDGSCEGASGMACVRQPDGSWRDVGSPGHSSSLAVVAQTPLVSGGVVSVLAEAAKETTPQTAKGRKPPKSTRTPEASTAPQPPHQIVRTGALGEHTSLASVDARGATNLQVEEIAPGVVRVIVPGPAGRAIWLGTKGESAKTVERPGIVSVRGHVGYAAVKYKAWTTVDGALSWQPLELPIGGSRVTAVSPLGLVGSSAAKVGWGPSPVPSAPEVAAELASSGPRPAPSPKLGFDCDAAGEAPRMPPISGANGRIGVSLGGREWPDAKRDFVVYPWEQFHPTDPIITETEALLEPKGGLYILRWRSALDVGRPIRKWVGSFGGNIPPQQAAWLKRIENEPSPNRCRCPHPDSPEAVLRSFGSHGAIAAFTIAWSRTQYFAVRVREHAAGSEVAPLPAGWDPIRAMRVGPDGTTAWEGRDGRVIVWRKGERPLWVTSVATSPYGMLALGAPSADTIPLLALFPGRSYLRDFSIPKLGSDKPAHPQALTFAGWRTERGLPDAVSAYPVCPASAAADSFTFSVGLGLSQSSDALSADGFHLELRNTAGTLMYPVHLLFGRDDGRLCLRSAVGQDATFDFRSGEAVISSESDSATTGAKFRCKRGIPPTL